MITTAGAVQDPSVGISRPHARSPLALLQAAIRSRFAGEFVLYACSTVAYQGSRFLVAFWAASLIGPTAFGLWNALNVITVYGPFLPLGVLNAMNRDVPLFKGKGDPTKVTQIRRVALGFITVVTIAVSIGLIVAAYLTPDAPTRIAMQLIAMLFVCTQFYSYNQCCLISDTRFAEFSRYQFILAAVLPIFVVPASLAFGLNGFIIGQAVTFFLISLVMKYQARISLLVTWNTQELRRLIRVGSPIAGVGLLYGFLTTLDRWVVLGFLGTTNLGYYSLVVVIFGFVNLLPRVMGDQVYPRMAETFGRTSCYESLKKWILGQIAATSLMTLSIIAVIYVVFPPVVRKLLPAYVDGISAVKIALLGLLFLPLASGMGNFLNTVDKQRYYLVVQALAIPVDVALSITFVKLGMGINGVALAMSSTHILYALALLIVGVVVLRRGCSTSPSEPTVFVAETASVS